MKAFIGYCLKSKPRREYLDDLIWYQSIDFENVTWITKEPITPFPGQLFEFNKVALGWRNKDVTTTELDDVIREEAWALSITSFGHLNVFVPVSSLNNEQVWNILRGLAADFNLDIESTSYDKRPKKPSFMQGCLTAPFSLVVDGLQKFTKGFKK